MRRADRLIDIVGQLRKAQRPVTAALLSRRFEVAERTIYRDIAALQAQGLPIDGVAGLGYVLTGPVDPPVLTFDHDQWDAMALGLSYVAEVGDARLAEAARSVRAKIESAWGLEFNPDALERGIRSVQIATRRAPDFASSLRRAIRLRQFTTFEYADRSGRRSFRRVRPLGLSAFSEGWLLVIWCETRQDFRSFRLDRIEALSFLDQTFPQDPKRNLAAYKKQATTGRPVINVFPTPVP